MGPQERTLWLAAHNAPKDMHLVTHGELANITGQIIAQQGALNAVVKQLGDYWTSEPDLANATASAVFDAGRFKRGVEVCLPGLRRAKAKLDKLIANTTLNFAVTADLIDLSKEFGDEIKFLENQAAARRERIRSRPPGA